MITYVEEVYNEAPQNVIYTYHYKSNFRLLYYLYLTQIVIK